MSEPTIDQQRLTDALRPEYERIAADLAAARQAVRDLEAQADAARRRVQELEEECGALVALGRRRLSVDLRNMNEADIPF